MKILRRRCYIADLNVLFGARLEKALEPRARVLGPLPFVAMRQQKDDSTRALPLRFRRHDKLIDNHLRAVGEIAELRFPKAKHVRVVERVTVVEPEYRRFRKQAVVDANARLVRR